MNNVLDNLGTNYDAEMQDWIEVIRNMMQEVVRRYLFYFKCLTK